MDASVSSELSKYTTYYEQHEDSVNYKMNKALCYGVLRSIEADYRSEGRLVQGDIFV